MAKNDKSLAQRVSALERIVRAEHPGADREAKSGERPDYLRVTRGNADYAEPVRREMARLKGQSSSEMMADDRRGASSPLTQPRRRK
jgi:hypothetical protein